MLAFLCICAGNLLGSVVSGLVAWPVAHVLNQRHPDAKVLWLIPLAAIGGAVAGPFLLEMFILFVGRWA